MKRNFVMKNTSLVFGAVLILMAALVLAGCGGEDPKKLAKETYDLGLQAMSAAFDSSKAADLEKKSAEIQKKVEKLSAANRVIYEQELARLTGNALDDLFESSGSSLNTDTEDLEKTFNDALKEASDAMDLAGDALKSIDTDAAKKALKDSKEATDAAKKALEESKKANDALKSLGY